MSRTFDEESLQTVTYCEHVKWLKKQGTLARIKNVRRTQRLHVYCRQSVVIFSMILRLISDYFWRPLTDWFYNGKAGSKYIYFFD